MPPTPDLFNLARFLTAQDPIIAQVRTELAAGVKRSHWMWFIFPQIAGLGHSAMSRTYAISGRAEADSYLAHPILGPRLIDCTSLVNAAQNRTAEQIFGAIDAQKFCSSMTLFAATAATAATAAAPTFETALQKYFGGQLDPATLTRL